MNQYRVFTPLRVALMGFIVFFNVLGLVSFGIDTSHWHITLGVIAVVFIMLFVFVILLEWVWLHHRGKAVTDSALAGQYRLAKKIYAVLFFMGFVISALILTQQ